MKYFMLFLFIVISCSCRRIMGDNPLGGNLSLMEGDKKEDRLIAYCEGSMFDPCTTGIQIIPTHERQFVKGNYAEYVEYATSDDDWVLAKTFQIKEKKANYWILRKDKKWHNLDCRTIKCDSLFQSHLIGPLDSLNFEQKKISLGINFDLTH